MLGQDFPYLIPALRRVVADSEAKTKDLKEHLVALINVPKIRFIGTDKAAAMLAYHLDKALKISGEAVVAWGGPDSKKNFKAVEGGFKELFGEVLNPRSMRLLLAIVFEAIIILDFHKTGKTDSRCLYGFSKPGKGRIEELLPVLELLAKDDYEGMVVAEGA